MQMQYKNPIKAFQEWFDNLFPEQRKYLAKAYLVLTTEDTNDFALDAEEALFKFRNKLLKQDFPLRQLSKIVYMRAVVDFILENRTDIAGQTGTISVSADTSGKVVDLREKHWEKVVNSWKRISNTELSDKAIQVWLKKITQNSWFCIAKICSLLIFMLNKNLEQTYLTKADKKSNRFGLLKWLT